MYAFRKPITATTFQGVQLWSVNYKVLLITAQVLGYLISKLVGIKVISELQHAHRIPLLAGCLSVAAITLALFGLVQGSFGLILLAINGFSLGFVWGIVYSFIEGRQTTDLLAVVLSITFIVASGWVKSVGRFFIAEFGTAEHWMPILTGLSFTPLLIVCILALNRIAPPNENDFKSRQVRIPLNRIERRAILRAFAPGLAAVLLVNLLLTVVREVKDNFIVEVFIELGLDENVSNYSKTESISGLVVLAALALLVFVRNNRHALAALHFIMLTGAVIMVVASLAYANNAIEAVPWVILQGVGLYVSYTSFQSLFFERFIAAFALKANVGFLIYIADFLGYLASCTFFILKEFVDVKLSWTTVLLNASIILGIAIAVSTILAWTFFTFRLNRFENERS
jgi:hypothetical protein